MIVRLLKSIILALTALFIMSCQPGAVMENSLNILLPLYAYPNWYEPENYLWLNVASAAAKVPITAIINPNNGPDGNPPNQDYQRGLEDLRQSNLTILGYVYTLYGDRSMDLVKKDIDLYAQHYNLDGIFLDESSSNAQKIDYYQEIYRYIKTQTNLSQVVINPGTNIDEGYLTQSATDTAVIFENYPQPWTNYEVPSYTQKYPGEYFACLIHSAKDNIAMKQYIDLARDRNFRYVYITDDSPDSEDKDPWNTLPSYWQEEVDYIQSLNQGH